MAPFIRGKYLSSGGESDRDGGVDVAAGPVANALRQTGHGHSEAQGYPA